MNMNLLELGLNLQLLTMRGNQQVDTETLEHDIRTLEFAHQIAAASTLPAYEPDLDTPRTVEDLTIDFLKKA